MNPDPDDVTFQFNQIQLTDKGADSVTQSKDADVSFGFNQVHANGGSKSVESTPENDDDEKSPENSPENADVDSGDDDVTFGSSQVRINNNKEMKPEDADVDEEDDDVTFGFSQENADVEGDDVEGEEFTFMCINSDNTVTELTEKTVFPLFDQSLLHNNLTNNEDGKRINVPVNNVFIESPRDSRADTSSSSSSSSTTTLTAITDSNEMNIKSNSTGFSKLWRFRDNNNINRSNSDGRDAFVFLNNPKTKEGGFLNNAKTEGGKGKGKGKGKEVNVVVKKKVKKANVASAHEVYLKQKGGEEESKRKSYLPYRPGLMGFFTNVNGGLSKNVHPF